MRGFPIPWFVWVKPDGTPDFRVIREHGIAIAYKKQLCWVCGEKLGRYHAFVVGPMCGVNRVTSEPSCHRECGEYAAIACPFLTKPLAIRNERGLPESAGAAGQMIKRNPGAVLLWVQKEPPKPFRVDNGHLFRLSDPVELRCFSRSKPANIEDVLYSVRTGMPLLAAMAKKDGPQAERALRQQAAVFDRILRESYVHA
ncbi:MAG: hypothetical protein K2X43_01080 [Hyphomonadaceae bacterium]|nr:hypothetical protein [Hyphomonadaceae bacterium]